MVEFQDIGDCRLYLGDCQAVLAGLDQKVAHVITDPPYEAEAHAPMRRTLGSVHKRIDAALEFGAITEELRMAVAKWSAENCTGWGLYFCQVEAVTLWRDALEEHGAKYRRAMVWVKPDASPQFNGQGPAQGYESIVAVWCGDGASRWNGGGKRGVFTHCKHDAGYGGSGAGQKVNEHQTKKPISLMTELVGLFTNPGELVIDPFMGSGSTGVACAKMGRRFIGVELERKHFDTSCRRIEEVYRQGDMFTPAPKMKQEAML